MDLSSQGIPVSVLCFGLLEPGIVGLGMSDVCVGSDLTCRLLVLEERTNYCLFADINFTTSEVTEITGGCIASVLRNMSICQHRQHRIWVPSL